MISPSRKVVLDIVLKAAAPLSRYEIHTLVSASSPTFSGLMVERVIKDMIEAGVLVEAKSKGSGAFYTASAQETMIA